MDRTLHSETIQEPNILELYKKLFTTPDPNNPNFKYEDTVIGYLESHGRADKARELLRYFKKAGLDLEFVKERMTVDQLLHKSIKGYCTLGEDHFVAFNIDSLQQNPFPINTIVHIAIHEGLHAGILHELDDVRVKDEALVELVTRAKIRELFNGVIEFESGYVEIVKALENLLRVDLNEPFDIDKVITQINSNNNTMLDNFLEMSVVTPLIKKNDMALLDSAIILQELRTKWGIVLKLFPRLINDIQGKDKESIHKAAIMNLSEYNFDKLLKKAAMQIANSPQIIKIRENVFGGVEDPGLLSDKRYVRNKLAEFGLGYLFDFISSEYNPAYQFVNM